ncbi:hypothetical protein CgunFtcFv8_027090 [Champsocephalus gunnari]|uniref:Uncharacterized protein n=1 Tax=Champsocephalus gunnari TaxID=52237 RepID=A0AAN8DYA3_CHAGU|nr:hypothetical protein CgunFtcFv8_027090 [Champsocephalus gunnari]
MGEFREENGVDVGGEGRGSQEWIKTESDEEMRGQRALERRGGGGDRRFEEGKRAGTHEDSESQESDIYSKTNQRCYGINRTIPM